jgi:hypothetical protein
MKPPYRTFNGPGDLPLAPPFRSLGLHIEYYALAASFEKLRAFCDRYLNFTDTAGDPVPPSVGRFAPLTPYVQLMMCRHPRLEVAHDRYGWFHQNELTFGFPVGWYEQRPWGWSLERWAYVNPAIFLDNFLGLGTGREVDGWPKKPARFEERDGVLTMYAMEAERGEVLHEEPLVEIRGDVRATPPEVWRQWQTIQREALETYVASLREAPAALAPWLRAIGSPWDYWALGRTVIDGVFNTNIVTLKQFRSVQDPAFAAYQALIRSTMQIDRIHGAGLLGEAAQRCGDPSGGYRVRLWEHTTDPIAEMLGLAVERVDVEDGRRVATLRPAFPFWMKSDITYPVGDVLCWRSEHTAWRVGGEPEAPVGSPNRYNETLAASELSRPGPFVGSDLTARVLPLRLDRATATAMCQRYYGVDGATVEVLGDHAYLVFFRGVMTCSPDTPLELRWHARTTALFIPARIDDTVGFVAPFAFATDAVAQVTLRELGGSVAALAKVTGQWVDADDGSLLRVHTMVFDELFVGAEGRGVDVLTVSRAPLPQPPGAAPYDRASVRARLRSAGGGALHVFDLKQYRDAHEPSRAAYQRLEIEQIALAGADDPVLLGDDLVVRIHDTPTWPIARLLGLKGERSDDAPEVLTVRAELPFEARVALTTDRPVMHRGGVSG